MEATRARDAVLLVLARGGEATTSCVGGCNGEGKSSERSQINAANN